MKIDLAHGCGGGYKKYVAYRILTRSTLKNAHLEDREVAGSVADGGSCEDGLWKSDANVRDLRIQSTGGFAVSVEPMFLLSYHSVSYL